MVEIKDILESKNYLGDKEAIIFDLDDTLYSEKNYVRSGYKVISEAFPFVDNMEEKLWQSFLRGEQAIDTVLKNENLFTDELKNKCLKIYRYHMPEIKLYDGVYELLFDLKKSSKKLGMITDGRPEGQRAKIDVLGLEKIFDKIIITDELGGVEFRKPNDLSFRMMSEYFGVPFSKMVYIGDNIKKDFIAPEKLGMQSIWFNNRGGLYCLNG